VVVHSYRHRYGLVPGDPAVESIEARLAGQPSIGVPTVAMDGDGDGVMDIGGCAGHAPHFKASYQRVVIPRAGHNLPQEAPKAFADAVLSVVPAD
jgi:pimeloyl-ACP methyl ester carboxylesterase